MDCKCSTLTGYSGVTNLLPPERLSATGPPPPLAACTTCADNTLCCAEGVRPAMRPRPPCKGQGTDDQGAVPPFVLGAGLAARARARRRSSVEVVSLASDATALTLALASKGSPKVDHSQPLTLFQRNSTGSCSPNKEGALMRQQSSNCAFVSSSQRSLSQPSSLAQDSSDPCNGQASPAFSRQLSATCCGSSAPQDAPYTRKGSNLGPHGSSCSSRAMQEVHYRRQGTQGCSSVHAEGTEWEQACSDHQQQQQQQQQHLDKMRRRISEEVQKSHGVPADKHQVPGGREPPDMCYPSLPSPPAIFQQSLPMRRSGSLEKRPGWLPVQPSGQCRRHSVDCRHKEGQDVEPVQQGPECLAAVPPDSPSLLGPPSLFGEHPPCSMLQWKGSGGGGSAPNAQQRQAATSKQANRVSLEQQAGVAGVTCAEGGSLVGEGFVGGGSRRAVEQLKPVLASAAKRNGTDIEGGGQKSSKVQQATSQALLEPRQAGEPPPAEEPLPSIFLEQGCMPNGQRWLSQGEVQEASAYFQHKTHQRGNSLQGTAQQQQQQQDNTHADHIPRELLDRVAHRPTVNSHGCRRRSQETPSSLSGASLRRDMRRYSQDPMGVTNLDIQDAGKSMGLVGASKSHGAALSARNSAGMGGRSSWGGGAAALSPRTSYQTGQSHLSCGGGAGARVSQPTLALPQNSGTGGSCSYCVGDGGVGGDGGLLKRDSLVGVISGPSSQDSQRSGRGSRGSRSRKASQEQLLLEGVLTNPVNTKSALHLPSSQQPTQQPPFRHQGLPNVGCDITAYAQGPAPETASGAGGSIKQRPELLDLSSCGWSSATSFQAHPSSLLAAIHPQPRKQQQQQQQQQQAEGVGGVILAAMVDSTQGTHQLQPEGGSIKQSGGVGDVIIDAATTTNEAGATTATATQRSLLVMEQQRSSAGQARGGGEKSLLDSMAALFGIRGGGKQTGQSKVRAESPSKIKDSMLGFLAPLRPLIMHTPHSKDAAPQHRSRNSSASGDGGGCGPGATAPWPPAFGRNDSMQSPSQPGNLDATTEPPAFGRNGSMQSPSQPGSLIKPTGPPAFGMNDSMQPPLLPDSNKFRAESGVAASAGRASTKRHRASGDSPQGPGGMPQGVEGRPRVQGVQQQQQQQQQQVNYHQKPGREVQEDQQRQEQQQQQQEQQHVNNHQKPGREVQEDQQRQQQLLKQQEQEQPMGVEEVGSVERRPDQRSLQRQGAGNESKAKDSSLPEIDVGQLRRSASTLEPQPAPAPFVPCPPRQSSVMDGKARRRSAFAQSTADAVRSTLDSKQDTRQEVQQPLARRASIGPMSFMDMAMPSGLRTQALQQLEQRKVKPGRSP